LAKERKTSNNNDVAGKKTKNFCQKLDSKPTRSAIRKTSTFLLRECKRGSPRNQGAFTSPNAPFRGGSSKGRRRVKEP